MIIFLFLVKIKKISPEGDSVRLEASEKYVGVQEDEEGRLIVKLFVSIINFYFTASTHSSFLFSDPV